MPRICEFFGVVIYMYYNDHRPLHFPKTFVDAAKRLVAQRVVALRCWQRARLVLLLHDHPQLSNVQAGRQVSLSDQTGRFWRRRWASSDFSLEEKPGRGRKPGF